MAKQKVAKKQKQDGYQGKVSLNGAKIAPRKARLVLDMVKDKNVDQALAILKFSPKKGAVLVYKLLQSAVANAVETGSADADKLWVVGGWVNEGTRLKRFMPRARGSATPILKRYSHITLEVAEV